MNDWFVTVLVSVRDMAAKNGMIALAEEMDVAILVAANESHDRDIANLLAQRNTVPAPKDCCKHTCQNTKSFLKNLLVAI